MLVGPFAMHGATYKHDPILTECGGVQEEMRELGAGHGDEHVDEEDADDEGPAPGGDLQFELHPRIINGGQVAVVEEGGGQLPSRDELVAEHLALNGSILM